MNNLKNIVCTAFLLCLVGCNSTNVNFDGAERDFLIGDRGGVISGCRAIKDPRTNEMSSMPIPKSHAKGFWEGYNLPKGTIDFVCRDGKAYLPKDCQGNSLNRQQILAYWHRYQLPKGLVNFDCSTGTPKVPANELKDWQKIERQDPTCRGGRPCV